MSVCFRCGSMQLPLQIGGDSCNNPRCRQPFVRCSITCDILPLIEFKPSLNSNSDEVISLLTCPSNPNLQHLFDEAVNETLLKPSKGYESVNVTNSCMESLDRSNIYSDGNKYFYNMIPDFGIALCQLCRSFFLEEEFERALLKDNSCPICFENVTGNVSVQTILSTIILSIF